MIDVTGEGLRGRANIVVLNSKLLASLCDYRRDLGVVGLDHAREEVVRGLVVECPGEDVPKPAVGGVVLCCCYLHLCPSVCVCVCVCVHMCA